MVASSGRLTLSAVLVGQIVVPALGGPLLGVALGRWVRMLAPFAFFTYTGDTNSAGNAVTAWRGSPWFFIGWQLALCAIAVLVALLRGAEGPVRSRIIRALGIAGATAVILLVLAATGGFTHAVTT